MLYIELSFTFTEYFLEDCVQMLNFVPPPNERKRKGGGGGDKEEGLPDDFEENLNTKVSNEYSQDTQRSVAKMSEKDIPFELIEVNW